MSSRTTPAALLVAALLLPALASAAQPKGNATFDHPWMPTREIGYQHDAQYLHDDSKFGVLFTRYFERYELREDGGVTTTLKWTLRTKNDARMPRTLHIATKSSARNTRVERFSAVLKTKKGIENIGADRLIEVGADAYETYIADTRWLLLMLPERTTGTLEFEVVLHEDPDPEVEGLFMGWQTVQVNGPAAERILEIAAPQTTEIFFEKRYFDAVIEPSTKDGVTTRRLRLTHLMPRFWSRGMPHSLDAFPLLAWSNQRDWAELGARFAKPWAARSAFGDDVAATARSITDGLESVVDRATAVHDYVADGWTYLGFYPGESGWVPHEVQDVWASRIGDCKDQTSLMLAMLRAADVEAYPAIGYAGRGRSFTSLRVPVVTANHAFVYVVDPDHPAGGFFINSTDVGFAATPQGPWMGGRDALVFFDGERAPELVPIPPSTAESRYMADHTRLELRPDGGAVVRFTRIHQGDAAADAYGRWRDSGPEERLRIWEGRLERLFPGAEVVSLREGPDGPGRWVFEAEAALASWATTTGELHTVTLPWGTTFGAAPPSAFGEDRIHPRALSGSLREQSFEVVVPAGAALVSIPDAGEHTWQNWRASFTSDPRGRTVVMTLRASESPGRMFRGDEGRRKAFHRWLGDVQQGTVVYRWSEGE